MDVKAIRFDQCQAFCKALWPGIEILPYSSMVLPAKSSFLSKHYSTEPISPTFLGAFVGDELAGINSFYWLNGTVRTRGLIALPQYGQEDVELALISKVIQSNYGVLIWDYAEVASIPSYEKLGFRKLYSTIYEDAYRSHKRFVMLDN
jgi:hypothetical protein